MNKVNALSLRQSLGKVLKQLEKGGAPVFVQRNRETVAVLVSMRDFSERFADKEALAEREKLVQEIHAFRRAQKPGAVDSVSILQDLRNSR
jgi:PHD/YefM family antitoxin component YafN of YafNO toxin-antitoxin module